MKRWLMFGLMSSVVWMSACSQPATTSGDAPSSDDGIAATDGSGDEAATAKRATAANQAYKGPVVARGAADPDASIVMINSGAGVLNPDFNEFIDLLPTYWHVESGPVRIFESGGPNRDPAVKMGPGYTYSFLSQDLVFDESPAGKTVTLTVMARCAEADKASVMIKLSENEKFYSDKHPGDDQWHELKISAQVPQNFEGDTITIFLTHSGSPKQPCWYDDVNVHAE